MLRGMIPVMEQIGLFGGTFDPVHNGHLAVARAFLRQFAPDCLIVIPASTPPHKPDQRLASFDHRLAMLKLVLAGEPRITISEIEGERGGPSYTVDTLAHYRSRFGNEADFFFLLGLDAFADLTTWKSYSRLLARTSFVVIDRPSHGGPGLDRLMAKDFPECAGESEGIWRTPAGTRIFALAMEPVAVSSSEVRARIREGKPVDTMVPPRVEQYIERHGLYRAP